MTNILAVRHDRDVDALYIRYSASKPVRQESLDANHFLNVDYDADGKIVGIELIAPRNDELEALTVFARKHDLSLKGLFAFT